MDNPLQVRSVETRRLNQVRVFFFNLGVTDLTGMIKTGPTFYHNSSDFCNTKLD